MRLIRQTLEVSLEYLTPQDRELLKKETKFAVCSYEDFAFLLFVPVDMEFINLVYRFYSHSLREMLRLGFALECQYVYFNDNSPKVPGVPFPKEHHTVEDS